MDLKVTDTLLEIYYHHERLTTHRRLPDYVTNQWSTHPEDMPDQFQHTQWDDTRIHKWAASTGSATTAVIERIFAGVKVKEQGYSSCLSVLRLSKTYTSKRLETACELALSQFRSPRYRHLKAILDANQDKLYQESKAAKKSAQEADLMGYVRGAAYYGGQRHD